MQKGYSSVLLTGLLLVGTLAVAQSGIGPITTSVHKARQAVGAPATRIAAGYKLRPLWTVRSHLKTHPASSPILGC